MIPESVISTIGGFQARDSNASTSSATFIVASATNTTTCDRYRAGGVEQWRTYDTINGNLNFTRL